MIQLCFEEAPNVAERIVRSSRFRIDGLRLTDAKGRVVAEVRPGHWDIAGQSATRWTCDGPVNVEFEFADGNRRCQSYPRLYVFGTTIRDGSEYLATLDGQCWRSFQT